MSTGASSTAARRTADSTWPGYLVAFAVAAALHAWWWMESARPWRPDLAPRVLREAPRLSYLGLEASRPDPGAADLWSPVLFALPSSAGFSPRADRVSLSPRNALRAGPGESALLDEGALPTAPAPGFLRSLQETVAALPPPLDLAPEEPAFASAGQATGYVLRVQWVDGPPHLQGAGVNTRDLAPYLEQRPWQATAVLQFDEFGTVRSVFLEEATSSRERNEAVVRALRRLRVAPGERPAPLARVQLQYDQTGLPPSAAEPEVPP